MSLQVWLPLNRDLRNSGFTGVDVANNGATLDNYAYMFDGNTSYISLNNVYQYFTGSSNPFSISFWFYHSGNNRRGIFFGNYGISDYSNCFNLEINDNNQFRIYWKGSPDFVPTYDYLTTQTWYHITVTYDGTKIRYYVNGVLKNTRDAQLSSLSTTSNFYIGRDSRTGATAFNGKISDFRIYDHALSEKEVRELSRGCILHYPCNDIINENTINLVTSLSSHLNVTINDKTVITTGQNVDTCFIINLSESISIGTQYTISCEANLPENTYWDFPLGTYENTALTWRIKPGYNEYTFIANNISWGVNRIFMDDLPSPARESGEVCKFYNFQLEKKDHATSYTSSSRTFPYLMDKSGFDNHSTITGSLPLATGSPRYKLCLNIDNSGTNKNYANCTIAAPQVKSASFWVYIGDSNPAYNMVFIDGVSKLCFGFGNRGERAICNVAISSTAINASYSMSSTKKNAWNHFVVIYDNTANTTSMYLNSVKLSNPTRDWWGAYDNTNFTLGLRLADDTNSLRFTGQVSDFRLFSRVLTQADVDDLYHDVTIIDNNQNEFTYELNEIDNLSTINITPDGLLKCRTFYEANIDTYDNTIYIEPDGSLWVRIFHHNNPANALFSASDTFTTGVYKDADRWFKVSLCDKVSQWELMVKQKTTSTATEYKGRWIQNANPMTAIRTDVTTDKISINTSAGYTNFSSGICGIIMTGTNANAYIIQTTNSGSGWWGGIGEYVKYQGGIERFALSGVSGQVTTGYLDLYLRIDNLSEEEQLSLFTTSENQVMRFGPNAVNSTNELNEI